MTKPRTRYTKSGKINIAYQVVGTGPVDLVYIPGWVSNIDLMWDCPRLARFLMELSEVSRVILFDKRGTGLSDRISELSTLEERMDDIRAVMDAVHAERAILFGHSEGGSVSALFSATYPGRTISLITFGAFAKRQHSVDYPWAPTASERERVYEMITTSWGNTDGYLETLAPSLAHDKTFMDWLATYFRSGASPSAALSLTKMNSQVDVIDILPAIDVPTLLMYRTHDIDVKIEEGKFIADRIRGSRFVEFPGEDHLFWAGDIISVLEEMKTFIRHAHKTPFVNRSLATILSIEISDKSLQKRYLKSTEDIDVHIEIDSIIEKKVNQYTGEVLEHKRGKYIAIFDGPSKAVHAAMDLRRALSALDLDIHQGIHIGECIKDNLGKVSGQVIEASIEITRETPEGRINASSTVVNLLSGAGLIFQYDRHLEISEGKIIQVLDLVDQDMVSHQQSHEYDDLVVSKSTDYTILDTVIEHIEANISNDSYSLEDLCADIGISLRQLQRKLKAKTNKTPSQLIRSIRLYKAKEFLLNENMQVKEVAYLSGFGNLAYFSKAFKKEFGISPSDIHTLK